MKNLENYGVQELNAREISNVDGGSLWEFVVEYVASELLGAFLDAAADHCDNGAGYGGYMDTHGKL